MTLFACKLRVTSRYLSTRRERCGDGVGRVRRVEECYVYTSTCYGTKEYKCDGSRVAYRHGFPLQTYQVLLLLLPPPVLVELPCALGPNGLFDPPPFPVTDEPEVNVVDVSPPTPTP